MEDENINIDDKIFRFIYIEAMRDATIQLAYKGEKRCLMGFTELDVWSFLKGEMESLIDKVLSNEYLSQDKYDEDFLNTMVNICKCINGAMKNDEFTFGNAQKLINIMLKYFYISSYKDNNSKVKFRFCHCPMDQQLLKNIWRNREELDSDKILGKREYFLKSWGNEDFEEDKNGKKMFPKRYVLFQQAVRCLAEKKNINPLEYDYCVW